MSTETVTPTAEENNGPLITVNDLYTVVRLLQDLADEKLWQGQKRLSETEISHVKPAFDKIVAFLAEYDRQMAAQNAAAQPSVMEQETELLDLDLGETAPVLEVHPTPKKVAKTPKAEKVVDKKKTPKKK